ncbi:MAG: bifunctional ornithine acetyltransferase/N-acetylglutamate synthase, partial [Hyphomonas sp.]
MNLTPSPFAPAAFPALPAVRGLKAATGSRGFYARRGVTRDDVFLAVFDPGTACGGVYTRSLTASADVRWCRQALEAGGGKAAALIANSGNSNAFTGPKGVLKNEATLAALVETLGVAKEQCFLAATGVIGEPLSDPNYVGAFVPELAGRLGPPDWEKLARAFMTTDTYPKGAGTVASIDGAEVRFAGIAKGSGMIAPNMATMLSYVFTDAAIAPELLQSALKQVADETFNSITVDGDTSTSDTLMVFA